MRRWIRIAALLLVRAAVLAPFAAAQAGNSFQDFYDATQDAMAQAQAEMAEKKAEMAEKQAEFDRNMAETQDKIAEMQEKHRSMMNFSEVFMWIVGILAVVGVVANVTLASRSYKKNKSTSERFRANANPRWTPPADQARPGNGPGSAANANRSFDSGRSDGDDGFAPPPAG